MHVTIALTTAGCPLRAQLMRDAKARVGSLPGIDLVKIHFGEMTADERKNVMTQARWKARDNALDTDIPATARILAISSGKGGVGKSSVTANLAVLLADQGYTVGVLDADVGGFSMPQLLGIDGEIEGERAGEGKTVMKPVVRPIGDGALHVVSMGSISGANETEAIMWRGMMLNRAVQHFLEDVQWGELDYLLIDMPPGTSDIQMGLARMLPRTDVVIVTTPAKGGTTGRRTCRRHGPQGVSSGWPASSRTWARRRRRTARFPRCSVPAADSTSPTASVSRCSGRSRSMRPLRPVAIRVSPSRWISPTPRLLPCTGTSPT